MMVKKSAQYTTEAADVTTFCAGIFQSCYMIIATIATQKAKAVIKKIDS